MTELAQFHYDRYHHNIALAGRLEAALPGDNNWACVIRFYAAVHLVSAYLAVKSNVRFNPNDASHADRKRMMDACPELNRIRAAYRHLKDVSESVRYDPGFVYGKSDETDTKRDLQKIADLVEPKLIRLAAT
jgi:hypothetical protein